ncbi:MAG: HupE/UreJ family protein [Thiotrichales bacterium]
MKRFAVLAFALLAATPVLAHDLPGAHSHGFGAGMLHPLLGVDHLLAIIALGLWASLLQGRARWLAPAVFTAFLLVGGLLGMVGMAIPHLEIGIALSVLVFGLMLASLVRNARFALLLAAGFALFHGNAHGVEMPQALDAMLYTAGYVTATAALAFAALGAGAWIQTQQQRLLRWGGGTIAALGLASGLTG